MQNRQNRTPYLDVLISYVKDKTLAFHTPGHQQGKGAPKKFVDFIGLKALEADITQILGMDDIHQPRGVIKEAHELAAEAYGADYSYFLINGSSSGNQAMILSVCNPGDEIIMPRNAHKSATGALILSGVRPVYIQPEFDPEMHVDHTISIEKLEKTLKKHPKAKAVFVVSPTYYGATADLRTIAKLAHKYGKAFIVDEAWGPHLHFHPGLPVSAMDAGADLSVNSTHKLISGFSQSSMLHLKGKRIDRGRLEGVLKIFLSTSPCSLLVASLDVARMQMATHGRELLTKTIALANYARDEINKIPGLRAYGKEIIGKPGVHDFDSTRLPITAKELGYTGYEVEKILRRHYNIQIEMSDLFNIVALITIGHSEREIKKLIDAFKKFASAKFKNGSEKSHLFLKRLKKLVELPPHPPQRMTPREAFVADFKTLNFKDSAGRTCSEIVTPYPPGIPILCPGEEITQEIIDYLKMELEAGIKIQGPVDPSMKTIRVVK